MKQLKTAGLVMSDLFNDLKQGLQESIKFEEGVGKAKQQLM